MRHAPVQGDDGLRGNGINGFVHFAGIGGAFGFVVALRQRAGGNAAEQPPDFIRGFLGLHVADDDQHGVVGGVPLFVPGAQIVGLQRMQVVHVADDGGFIERFVPHFDVQRFPHFAGRAVVGAHPAFFADNVHFVVEGFVAEIEVDHAVGLHFQHFVQIFNRNIGGIDGFGTVGVGIVVAAQRRHTAAEFALGHAVRTFEHHVLQSVAQAGFALMFVHAADLVPQPHGRHRRARILLNQHLHPVGQRREQRFRLHRRQTRQQQQSGIAQHFSDSYPM